METTPAGERSKYKMEDVDGREQPRKEKINVIVRRFWIEKKITKILSLSCTITTRDKSAIIGLTHFSVTTRLDGKLKDLVINTLN